MDHSYRAVHDEFSDAPPSTIELLHRYMGLKHPKPPSAYYTDRFIAGGAG
jgi:hypothetical protein